MKFTIPFIQSVLPARGQRWRRRLGYARVAARYAMTLRRHSTRNEFERPEVEHVTLRWSTLPRALHGLRVVQLTDLHSSPWVSPRLLRAGAELALAQRGDVIVLTGDYVTFGQLAGVYARRCAWALAPLRAPLGVYGCLGNHDHWGDPRHVLDAFREVGIPMLVNAHRRLEVDGASLWVAGVDDIRRGRPDLRRALHGIPAPDFTLLLAHQPDFADKAALQGVDLQLSGHSHGGQVVVPGVPVPWLPAGGRKYPRGLYRVRDMWLYVNRGLGGGFPPLRHNCPPEVTVITLERG